MRTTFSGIYLFNDDDFRTKHIFIFNEKLWQGAKLGRDRERARERDRVLL
jgi:hypothetical protein